MTHTFAVLKIRQCELDLIHNMNMDGRRLSNIPSFKMKKEADALSNTHPA